VGDLVVQVGFFSLGRARNRWRRYGQLIATRSADGEGIDEFALVVRLPELKNNLHSQFSVSSDFAIRAIASNFVDVTTSFLLFGSRKCATHLSDVLVPLPTGSIRTWLIVSRIGPVLTSPLL